MTGQFLISELRRDSYLEGLSITTSKSTRDGLLLTVLVITGVSSWQIIGEEFFFYLVQFQLNRA